MDDVNDGGCVKVQVVSFRRQSLPYRQGFLKAPDDGVFIVDLDGSSDGAVVSVIVAVDIVAMLVL